MSEHLTADLRPNQIEGDFEPVLYHRGNYKSPLLQWTQLIQQASNRSWEGVRAHSAEVMRMIGDSRVLFTAATIMRANGPKAPGPNSVRLELLNQNELWTLCKTLGRAINSDTYRPDKEKVIRVQKASGNGKRPIVLMNLQDRIVHKAAALVLQTMFDMRFDPLSFGFRAGRSRFQAIAAAEVLTKSGNFVWLSHDLQDAFGRVPIPRLLDVVYKLLPCERLKQFLQYVLPPQSRSLGGLKQGGALSALIMELYLTHFLHEPWRKAAHSVQIIRYADDLLLLSPNKKSARQADHELRSLLTPNGMLLKSTYDEALIDIRKQSTDWLGFQLCYNADRLQVSIGTNAFDKLAARFLLAHEKNRSAERASEVLRHWVAQLGPCYKKELKETVIVQALNLAKEHGFEELPQHEELQALWLAASKRWRRIKNLIRRDKDYFTTGPLSIPTPTSVIQSIRS